MAKRPPTRRNNCLSRSHQKSADAYVGTAIAPTNMGDCEYAKEAIQQARELNAQLSSAVVHLGYLYTDDHLGHSDPEADRRLFKQATQLRDPFAGIALLNLQTPVHSHLSLPAERAAQECHPGSRSFFYGRAIQTIFHIQPETWPNRERLVKESCPMPKKLFRPLHHSQGFTLVEMIGVLAIIAILIALLLPRIFTLIGSAKANSLTAAVRTYETAVAKYYGDIGTIWPLNAAGTPAQETGGNSATVTSLAARLTLDASDPLNTGTNQWSRFRGPYLEKFNTNTPPGLGTTMYLPAQVAIALGAATTATNVGWDLKGNDGNSDLPTGARVAYLRVDGVSDTEFNEIDGIIDAGVGSSLAERQLRGRVKYSAANDRLYVYLTHQ